MAVRVFTEDALLLRTVTFGESDAILTLLFERSGKIACLARGARASQRRFRGALEPMHTLRARVEDKGNDLATMKEAEVVRVRIGLARSLDGMDAAGTALRWARHLCPQRTPEPDVFRTLEELLDALDAGQSPLPTLATAGLAILSSAGYGLELSRCLRCGKVRPEGKDGTIDLARGGLVCHACGGARHRVAGPALDAATSNATDEVAAKAILALVEGVLVAHAELAEFPSSRSGR